MLWSQFLPWWAISSDDVLPRGMECAAAGVAAAFQSRPAGRCRPQRFGFVFAVISSLHSYLILADAGSKKAAQDVGFYYAANAAGRLFGIVLSGALAQYGGLPACLWGSAAMLAICLTLTLMLPAGSQPRGVPVAG